MVTAHAPARPDAAQAPGAQVATLPPAAASPPAGPLPDGPVPTASVADTARVVANVLLPLVSRGLIVRRPPIVAVAERLDLDRSLVTELQRLRRRYGPGPVRLRLPVRDVAVVLDPDDVRRILAASPVPFAADPTEKKHALSRFQPEGVLASSPEDRPERRRFNEQALDTGSPIHHLAPGLLRHVREEADDLALVVTERGTLDWDSFIVAWWRVVRRVVFGAGARDDHELTDTLGSLRARANWSYLAPDLPAQRERFHALIRGHLDRAERGSLAEHIAQLPAGAHTQVEQQIPQWLFAYDPGGIAAYRALALLAAHRGELDAALDEVSTADSDRPAVLPRLRAAVLDGLRLWPTTPAVLRESSEATSWRTGRLPAGTSLVIAAPFFHRDDTRLAYADRFAPELWLGDASPDRWPLIPFSDGPVVCPGRELVLLTTSTFLARLLERLEVQLDPHDRLRPDRPMPSVLDPFHLGFRTRRRT